MPYHELESDLAIPPIAISDGETKKARLVNIEVSFQAIKDAVLQCVPIIVVIQMCQAFFLTKTGIVDTPLDGEIIPELHAVLVMGVKDCGEPHESLEFRNSWGTVWGVDGYGWISESYVTRCAVAALSVQPI